jgi:protocatechuate 3,4-dioxygenase beta subunit
VKIIPRLACAALALYAVHADAQGSIAGTVYDSLSTHAPLANATIVLVERSRYATTDAHGYFQIDSVPDGRYTIGIMHPVLDSLDLTAPVVAVDVTGGLRTTVALFTPGPAAAYARICPDAYAAETGLVVGRVHDVDDQSSLADATVTTDWTEYTVSAGRTASHRVRAAARTNLQGVYLLCGVPTTVPLDVHTELAGFSAGPTPLLLNDRLIGRVDFALSRRDSAARVVALGDSSSVAAGSGTASLRGTVVGGDGRPMRDAVVSVLGTPRSAHTDGAGAFRIDHIPAGTRTIEVRAIGLLPMTVSMDFATNAARDTTLSLSRQAQPLKPVAVKGSAILPSWMVRSGFETRRLQGMGAFVTEQDIARHGFSDLISVLQGVRGVNVQWGGTGKTGGISFPLPYLLGVSSLQGSLRCRPNFFLDGAPFPRSDFKGLSSIVQPGQIKGIEVYSSPGTIPAQYDLTSSTGCGSIVIWTR